MARSSEWEALQSLLIRAYNREVNESFADNIADDFEGAPEATLKHMLLIRDKDSQTMCQTKMLIFMLMRQGIQADNSDLLHYLQPTLDPEDRPRLVIVFREKPPYLSPKGPVYPEMSCRLKMQTEDITTARFTQLATKVKQIFPKSFVWDVGPQKWLYHDEANGYRLKPIATSEAEARTMVNKMLDIQDVAFDEKFFKKGGEVRRIVKTTMYKGELVRSERGNSRPYKASPWRAELHPGSGIKPEILVWLNE